MAHPFDQFPPGDYQPGPDLNTVLSADQQAAVSHEVAEGYGDAISPTSGIDMSEIAGVSRSAIRTVIDEGTK